MTTLHTVATTKTSSDHSSVALTAAQLTPLQRDFINTYQGNFPLHSRPFKDIAEQLGSTEEEVIQSLKQLHSSKLLTRFGPLFNAERLGGGLTLAALSVPLERYDVVTEQVNAFTEVAHNYRREHELNMWFVIASETPDQINRVILSIQKVTGLKVYDFPKQQEFYIGLWLQLSADGSVTTVPVPVAETHREQPHDANAYNDNDNDRLDSIDRKLITLTQSGLAIAAAPYRVITNQINISEQEVIDRLRRMLEHGIIRRIGAVPYHHRLGLTANGMTVWAIDEDRISEMGERVGQLDFVSHCYQRPRLPPEWPYNLFAMVHGHNREEVLDKTRQIEAILGKSCYLHDILFSTRILKKTGLRLAA